MRKVLIIIFILTAAFLTACNGAAPEATPVPPTATEEPEVYYTIIVKADPSQGGIVVPTKEEVLEGTMIQVQAKPAPGYEFAGWSGDIALSSPEVSLTMDSDKLLTAHFESLATDTPLPPTVTPTPKHSPTPEDPGVCSLTQWCNDHVGCETFQVKNQSPFAIGIYLRHEESSISCEYYTPPKGNLQIVLRPGRYYYIFTTCNGKYVYDGYHHLSGKWYWLQKEKFCK